MKTKVVVFALATLFSFSANADRYGHGRYGHAPSRHHGHGNHWIAPAIIGGVIADSALYEATRDREPPAPHEMKEEQLRRREIELERREHEYYERQRAQESEYNETCREYYRNDGDYSYYSRNCWER